MGFWQRFAYNVRMDAPGRLNYREGNQEYVFPVYEKDGEVVIAGLPSRRRIFFFFNWCSQSRDLPEADQQRILPRLLNFFQRRGKQARIFDRGDVAEHPFVFFPELFEERSKASDLLDLGGFAWFSDYSSIDLLHEDYGLEVCGIKDETTVKPIAEAMQSGFPHWHHYGFCFNDFGRDPGWKFAIHMFPKSCGGGRCPERRMRIAIA